MINFRKFFSEFLYNKLHGVYGYDVYFNKPNQSQKHIIVDYLERTEERENGYIYSSELVQISCVASRQSLPYEVVEMAANVLNVLRERRIVLSNGLAVEITNIRVSDVSDMHTYFISIRFDVNYYEEV